MILVSYEQRELDVEPFHHLVLLLVFFVLLELDLPVRENTLDEKVKTYKEVDSLIIGFDLVKALGEQVDFEDLRRELIHVLLLQEIQQELLTVDRPQTLFDDFVLSTLDE